MKILHYSLGLPPLRTGGLTKYSVDIMLSQVENGDEVYLLYPGHFTLDKKLRVIENKSFKGVRVFEILNPLFIPLMGGISSPKEYLKNIDINIYLDFLRMVDAQIIHIHTLMGFSKEMITAAYELNIKTVFTSHDYFGICPKVNLIDLQGEICSNYDNGKKCVLCNANGYSNSLMTFMQSMIYRKLKNSYIIKKLRTCKKEIIRKKYNDLDDTKQIDVNTSINIKTLSNQYVKLRKYYIDILNNIDCIHYNSSLAKKVYEKYIDNTNSRVLNISHLDIKDNRVQKNSNPKDPLKITYIGPIEKYKGVFFLLDVLKKLLKNNINNWDLNLYGGTEYINLEKLQDKVTVNGTYDYSKLGYIFKNTDVLVVPSIWYETFGYIALEAFSYGVPVIMTQFVGFKDMITNEVTGIVIKADQDELYRRLQSIIKNRTLLSRINGNINKLPSIYTMEKHTLGVMDLYTDLIKGEIVLWKY